MEMMLKFEIIYEKCNLDRLCAALSGLYNIKITQH